MLSFLSAIFLALSFYAGCGGSSDGVLPVSYSAGSQDIVAAEEEPLVIDNDDAYYAALEKKLNDELDVNRAPDKCAAQGLSKITLSFANRAPERFAVTGLTKIVLNFTADAAVGFV